MQSKHTPGPWRAERIGGAWRGSKEKGMAFRVEAPESSTAKNWDVAVIYNKPLFEDAQANARLIAAAPDLLAALTRLLSYAEQYGGYKPGSVGEHLYVAEARDALAKARGQ